MISAVLLILACAILYFAVDLRRLAATKAEETGVSGSILYSDADHLQVTENLTCELDDGVRLAGKPDYILKLDGKLVPLEYKSGRAPARLFPSHENQIGAYFLLIESRYGTSSAPPYGTVRFSDGKEFQVVNSAALRGRVLAHAREMAEILDGTRAAGRDHHSAAKCAACEFFPVCDERIETRP